MPMRCGDTFLLPPPGGPVKTHLWIVITEPQAESRATVIVNLTTLRASRDQTVILGVGDHPFVRHQTAVSYRDALTVDAGRIEALLREGAAIPHQPCSAGLLSLIQDGALASPHMPKKVAAFCKQAWGR
jgi:hypothetical protein